MSIIKPALLHPERINHLSGANNYSWIHFRDGEKKLLAKPISYLELLLPDFIRVHKTALLNPAFITKLYQPPRRKMSGKVYMDTGDVFPVSRRRLQTVIDLLQRRDEAVTQIGVIRETSVGSEPEASTTASVFLVTEDENITPLLSQIVTSRKFEHQLHVSRTSTSIPDLLKPLPLRDYPSLLFLDARTAMLERLNTLQRLRIDKDLCRIPVILIVSPTDQQIINGYQHQANSVVTFPAVYPQMESTLERICQFWLRIVALPNATTTGMVA
ncbi:LytTR family transcriptional regulator DNA-binding domain-containing protein [Spirosoma sp. BT702]|uniref:LytTR family transcriptional regulator DNA-binding domain-containing protein n=1 Tax=Spirosoma profusum TaxID=2771354 RepID=A0A927ATE9_9BACT|nr:LytTR family transcriptional regulator DNA-binding domain-containing protein [Spirosoma profusum]MBD2700032.1 LytTR family transcriptional regulator DNA-binding domain-containing protein [Spirosoma profusum]